MPFPSITFFSYTWFPYICISLTVNEGKSRHWPQKLTTTSSIFLVSDRWIAQFWHFSQKDGIYRYHKYLAVNTKYHTVAYADCSWLFRSTGKACFSACTCWSGWRRGNWICIPTSDTWVICINARAAAEVMTAVTQCVITVLSLFCTDSLRSSFRYCLTIRHLSRNFYLSVSLLTLHAISSSVISGGGNRKLNTTNTKSCQLTVSQTTAIHLASYLKSHSQRPRSSLFQFELVPRSIPIFPYTFSLS
jgi:hypothetical protein